MLFVSEMGITRAKTSRLPCTASSSARRSEVGVRRTGGPGCARTLWGSQSSTWATGVKPQKRRESRVYERRDVVVDGYDVLRST